jgi:signal transduction histidine kinase
MIKARISRTGIPLVVTLLLVIDVAVLLMLSAGLLSQPSAIAVALGLLLLSIVVTAVAGAIEYQQQRAYNQRLDSAHAVLDSAAELLEGPRSAADCTEPPALDSLVERLERLVGGVHRLVDERQQREREVMRADQLAMVGQLAAGVAHELRNPLTSIKMLVQSGQKEGAAALTADDMAIIEHEIRRLERSLQRFLDFARPPRPQRQPLNLTKIIECVLALVEGRACKQRVELIYTPPPDAIVVDADEDQLQQLLLNLLLNALDVMPEGGTVTVDLASTADRQVELRVCDTGPGISEQLLPRLFDPFISTKQTGIGLGLAVSHRIAERHGGRLSAHNRPGGGACFVLRLAETETASSVTSASTH